MKLQKRFVLTSKEDIKKNAHLRRTLTLVTLISAIIVPLINDGVIYTIVEFTDNDVAVAELNMILRYTMVIHRYLGVFVSFAAVITGIFHYGYKSFKTPPLLLLIGSFVKYLIAQYGSLIFCYEVGIIYWEGEQVAANGLDYLFLAVFDFIKNIVLIVVCCRFARKERDDLPDSSCRPDQIKLLPLLRASLKRSNSFFSFCLFAAGVEAVYGALSRFLSVTMFQIIADGMPATGLQYIELLSGYLLILPFCAAGFVLCVTLCTRFSYLRPAKRK